MTPFVLSVQSLSKESFCTVMPAKRNVHGTHRYPPPPPPPHLEQQWQRWERSLPQHVTCPRALTSVQERIEDIKLHAFGGASGKGVAASVYAVVKEPFAINQGLVTAKARLAKQGITTPRRELVSGHMAVNLLTNVQDALQGFPVTLLQSWLDSSLALH